MGANDLVTQGIRKSSGWYYWPRYQGISQALIQKFFRNTLTTVTNLFILHLTSSLHMAGFLISFLAFSCKNSEETRHHKQMFWTISYSMARNDFDFLTSWCNNVSKSVCIKCGLGMPNDIMDPGPWVTKLQEISLSNAGWWADPPMPPLNPFWNPSSTKIRKYLFYRVNIMWPGDARSQGISNYDIDNVEPN